MRSPTDRTSSRFSTSTTFPTTSASLFVSLLLVSTAPCSASPRKNNGLFLRLFLTSFFCAFSEPRVVVPREPHGTRAGYSVAVRDSVFVRLLFGSSSAEFAALGARCPPYGCCCWCWSFQGCHQAFLVAVSVRHSLKTQLINSRFLSHSRAHPLAEGLKGQQRRICEGRSPASAGAEGARADP